MKRNNVIVAVIIGVVLLSLCGCDNAFNEARQDTEEYRLYKELSVPVETDVQVDNIAIDYVSYSSYSNYIDITGNIKNISSKEISSVTLTLYVYDSSDTLVETEKEYIYDLGPGDEDAFTFMASAMDILMYKNFEVKVTDIF